MLVAQKVSLSVIENQTAVSLMAHYPEVWQCSNACMPVLNIALPFLALQDKESA